MICASGGTNLAKSCVLRGLVGVNGNGKGVIFMKENNILKAAGMNCTVYV